MWLFKALRHEFCLKDSVRQGSCSVVVMCGQGCTREHHEKQVDLIQIPGPGPVGPIPAPAHGGFALCKLLSLLGLRHGSFNLDFGCIKIQIFFGLQRGEDNFGPSSHAGLLLHSGVKETSTKSPIQSFLPYCTVVWAGGCQPRIKVEPIDLSPHFGKWGHGSWWVTLSFIRGKSQSQGQWQGLPGLLQPIQTWFKSWWESILRVSMCNGAG